jgi:hypothetical protein
MGLVDKVVFENRGAHGSCDSDYAFALTTSAYGMFRHALIVGVELPAEPVGVPPGLTAVNYSGPARDRAGAPVWTLSLTVAR